jgi:hypothetical protein
MLQVKPSSRSGAEHHVDGRDPVRGRAILGLVGLLVLVACGTGVPRSPSVAPSEGASADGASDASQLEGVWHTGVLTPDDFAASLQAAGLGEYAQGFLDFWKPGAENVFSLRISGGFWAFYRSRDGGIAQEEDSGSYTIHRNTVTIRHNEGTDTLQWSVSGDTLTITYLSDTMNSDVPRGEEIFQRVIYMSSPWTRGKP